LQEICLPWEEAYLDTNPGCAWLFAQQSIIDHFV